ncbi:MAG: IS200/IS605 family transposase [Nitrosopumilus sp.]|nr:IS200/IS605 family transposase [Nitrosopumilus sp.]MDF2426340.1 IS200/IS605 family transposase [Nitrosopumilus sp.]
MYHVKNCKFCCVSYQLSFYMVSKISQKKILAGGAAEFIESQIREIASGLKYDIIEVYVMPDHIHLFVRCDPFESPVNVVKRFKAVTSIHTFRQFPELRHKMRKGVLRSPSYYVGTAGHASAQTIARYTREQEGDSSAG